MIIPIEEQGWRKQLLPARQFTCGVVDVQYGLQISVA